MGRHRTNRTGTVRTRGQNVGVMVTLWPGSTT